MDKKLIPEIKHPSVYIERKEFPQKCRNQKYRRS